MLLDLPPDVLLRLERLAAGEPPPLEVLHATERERLTGFRSARRQRAFTLGRAAVRRLAAEHLACTPEAVPLRVAEDGAPEVAGLHVSLAHTEAGGETLAVAVLAPHAVGVDVEALRPHRADLHERLLAPGDRAVLAAFPPDEATLTVWVLKEAVLKAMRTGFRCSPRLVHLHVEGSGHASAVGPDGRRWTLRHAHLDGVLLALAVEAP